MQEEFINPNFHVILIHYPLAMLVVGVLIELFAFLWKRSGFRAAGRWMLLIGALSLAPAATSGLYALHDVNRTPDTPLDESWVQVRAQSPVQGPAWEMMKQHAWYTASGSVAILLLVVIWLAGSDRFRARFHLVFLLLMIAGLGAITLGAWHGGEMIYRHGVGVNAGAAESDGKIELKREVEYYLPPMQVHVILAGLTVALGLAAIGLSMRAGTMASLPAGMAPPISPELSDINYALNPNLRNAPVRDPAAQMNQFDDQRPRFDPRRTPVARFFLLAMLLGIGTALTGWWLLASSSDTYVAKDLWAIVAQNAEGGEFRGLAHVGAGVAIVLLMLLMAVLGRMAVGRKVIMGSFSLLLIAAMASQIWLGSLLMFDTATGSILKFNGEETPTETKSPASAPATSVPTAPATEKAPA